MNTPVTTKKVGAVLEVALNLPERRNAMSMVMFEHMKSALEAAAHSDIRCVMLHGEGKIFCVGGDIKVFAEFAQRGETIPESAPDSVHILIQQIRHLPKPVMVVAHGACAGAGLSLLLACDLAIASDDCKFNLAYTGIGLSPDGGSTYFLPRHVGLKRATEIFLTAKTMSAQEALDLGLVNRLEPTDQLLDQARAMAQMLSLGPTKAYARVKQLLNATFDNTLHAQLALESQCFSQSTDTADFCSGVTAFLEKRAPVFTGK